MPAATRAQSAKRRAATTRPVPAPAGAAGPLRPRDPNVTHDTGRHALKPTKNSLAAATAGSAKAVEIQRVSDAWEKSEKASKPTKVGKAKARPPPKMTASFVMGVQQPEQRHPSRTRRRASKDAAASTAHASLIQAAKQADASAAASREAAKHASEAVTEARQLAAKASAAAKAAAALPGGGRNAAASKAGKGPSKAVRAAARVTAMRAALGEATRLAARTAEAQKQVQQYTVAWEAMVGRSWADETLPVGHKLKQLCRECGAAMGEDGFATLFSRLGGVGSTVRFEKFLAVMVELGHAGVGMAGAGHAGASTGAGASAGTGTSATASTSTGAGTSATEEGARTLVEPDALARLRAEAADALEWLSFRELVCFDPRVDAPDAEAATALTDDEARALFRHCCGSSEGAVARSQFLEAVDSFHELSA